MPPSEAHKCASDSSSDTESVSWSEYKASLRAAETYVDIAITHQPNSELRERDAVKSFFDELKYIKTLNIETREWIGTLPSRMSTEAIPLFTDSSTGTDYQLHCSYTWMAALHTAGRIDADTIDPYFHSLLYCEENDVSEIIPVPDSVIPIGKLFANESNCSKWTGYEVFVSRKMELWIVHALDEDDSENEKCVACNLMRPAVLHGRQDIGAVGAASVKIAQFYTSLSEVESTTFEHVAKQIQDSKSYSDAGVVYLLELSTDQVVRDEFFRAATLYRSLEMGGRKFDPRGNIGHQLLQLAKGNTDMAVTKIIISDQLDVFAWRVAHHGGDLPCIAAYEEAEVIIRLLLDTSNINLNSTDDHGNTPLSIAIIRGHESIARLLLKRDDIEVNSRAENGYTALIYAARLGYDSIVKLLLERDEIQVNSETEDGETALIFAAQNNNESIFRLLLQRDDINVDIKTTYGDTLLMSATRFNNESIVKLLFERDQIQINSKAQNGETALIYAAQNNNELLIRLFLKQEDIEANAKTSWGDTALVVAARYGNESIVKLLLEQDDIDVNVKTAYNDSVLSLAIALGYEGVAKMLREHGARESKGKGGERATSVWVGRA